MTFTTDFNWEMRDTYMLRYVRDLRILWTGLNVPQWHQELEAIWNMWCKYALQSRDQG